MRRSACIFLFNDFIRPSCKHELWRRPDHLSPSAAPEGQRSLAHHVLSYICEKTGIIQKKMSRAVQEPVRKRSSPVVVVAALLDGLV